MPSCKLDYRYRHWSEPTRSRYSKSGYTDRRYPPPLANNPCWWGDQAMALTAAVWSEKRWTGWVGLRLSTTCIWLSFPPLAKKAGSSNDQRRPHTSCRWAVSRSTNGELHRTSRRKINRSRLPLASMGPVHAKIPTRAEWPAIVRTLFTLMVSHSCVSPLMVPTAKCTPLWAQATEVTKSSVDAKSHNLVTLDVQALQR
jgi:hypothetical protein